jgi:hypothetical protein
VLPWSVAFADDKSLMDVTLRRDGKTRRWNIVAWANGWRCTLSGPGMVAGFSCDTVEQALAQKREWDAQIVTALAEGWA